MRHIDKYPKTQRDEALEAAQERLEDEIDYGAHAYQEKYIRMAIHSCLFWAGKRDEP